MIYTVAWRGKGTNRNWTFGLRTYGHLAGARKQVRRFKELFGGINEYRINHSRT